MKYFTKELYEESQIRGFLIFHETEKDWEDDIAWYESEGLNFKEICKNNLEDQRADLLKYLPASFHPYIQDGTLKSEFPSEKLRKMADKWLLEYHERVEAKGIAYRNYYNSIKKSLPENVIHLYEKTLHDAQVTSIEQPLKDTIIMTLDCRGSYHYLTDIRLVFTGVQNIQPTNLSVGSGWLYDEVYLTETGFELHVLLDGPLMELTISAENVNIEVIS
ncbi:hypothetical protein J45TS6_35560 [Paenibacillus sp. J45TS6]|uniref:DUF4085 family protein n=1 Tax=Paenibacillus sp. J45TS6 TaxID=2807196 RepID=UPI001B2391AE|nr:DUF4085 family protein [Paenibacillus sp. J45TS6]GIP45097.1 hypothetical protein J45TS6_35560 [Paenibacillus sp. J45TS6]